MALETYISSAVNNWMYTGWSNPIYMSFVSSNYGSTLDFHAKPDIFWTHDPDDYIFGKTYHRYSGEARAYPSPFNSVSRLYADTYINDDNFRLSFLTNEMAGGTMRHEIGHALG